MSSSKQLFYKAFIEKDPGLDGVFFAANMKTGHFCRPTCPQKAGIKDVEFSSFVKGALLNGYRPCKICKPLESTGQVSSKMKLLLQKIEENPAVKIDNSILEDLDLEVEQVHEFFKKNYKMTLPAFQKLLRINTNFQKVTPGQKLNDFTCDSVDYSIASFAEIFNKIFPVSAKSKSNKIVNIEAIETELGLIIAGATDKGICLLEFADSRLLIFELKQLQAEFKAKLRLGNNQYLEKLKIQLKEYFQGKRQEFDLPLDLAGTEFQKKVWLSLLKIPYGKTASYAEQAELLGNPKAVRAVANANGKNKVGIVLPCHRIIGADGTMTGYGGGIWRKIKLLKLEQGRD